MDPTPHKQCRRCGENKPLTEYSEHKKTKDKLQSWCKCCRKTYAIERYNKNATEDNARRREYYKKTGK